jgi:hypothetical protein
MQPHVSQRCLQVPAEDDDGQEQEAAQAPEEDHAELVGRGLNRNVATVGVDTRSTAGPLRCVTPGKLRTSFCRTIENPVCGLRAEAEGFVTQQYYEGTAGARQ